MNVNDCQVIQSFLVTRVGNCVQAVVLVEERFGEQAEVNFESWLSSSSDSFTPLNQQNHDENDKNQPETPTGGDGLSQSWIYPRLTRSFV